MYLRNIHKNIGYADSRENGMMLLAEYNKSPWDIDAGKTTLESLWELFKEKKMIKMGNIPKTKNMSIYLELKTSPLQ